MNVHEVLDLWRKLVKKRTQLRKKKGMSTKSSIYEGNLWKSERNDSWRVIVKLTSSPWKKKKEWSICQTKTKIMQSQPHKRNQMQSPPHKRTHSWRILKPFSNPISIWIRKLSQTSCQSFACHLLSPLLALFNIPPLMSETKQNFKSGWFKHVKSEVKLPFKNVSNGLFKVYCHSKCVRFCF